MSEVKPIETRYHGYRFRSRLEARYAVLFDCLGMAWQYEPEGFELGNGERYLPDFWCPYDPIHKDEVPYPNPGIWIEIKPTLPSELEVGKLSKVCQATKHHGIIVCGPPDINLKIVCVFNSGQSRLSDAGDRFNPDDLNAPAIYDGRQCLLMHLHQLHNSSRLFGDCCDAALAHRFD